MNLEKELEIEEWENSDWEEKRQFCCLFLSDDVIIRDLSSIGLVCEEIMSVLKSLREAEYYELATRGLNIYPVIHYKDEDNE